MMDDFLISKFIEIDAAHRIPLHDSKCKSLHGHRYKIEAVCSGNLETEGSGTGMVLDFGFLKGFLVDLIDKYCDHALILSVDDPIVKEFFELPWKLMSSVSKISGDHPIFGKYYLIGMVPTAENLACHWYNILNKEIDALDYGVSLYYLRVYETPTCWAQYPGIA